jgi:hypothetical protein
LLRLWQEPHRQQGNPFSQRVFQMKQWLLSKLPTRERLARSVRTDAAQAVLNGNKPAKRSCIFRQFNRQFWMTTGRFDSDLQLNRICLSSSKIAPD